MSYYLYDPGYNDFTEHLTLDAALASATSLINAYRDQCDPEWPEYVEDIRICESDDAEEPGEGKLVAWVVEHNRIERPDDVDEDGYSPSCDLWFDQVDFYVDYRMEVVRQ